MLAALLIPAAPFVQHAEEPVAPPPAPRVLEIALTREDPRLEGHGPCRWIDHEVAFRGTLHAWTRSETDLFLRVTDEAGAVLGEDGDPGRGRTPYLELEVEPGDRLRIAVATEEPESLGSLALHLTASLETEATRAAAQAVPARMAAVEARRAEGDFEGSLALLEEALADLRGADAATWSRDVAYAAWFVAGTASDLEALATCQAATRVALTHFERTLPESHPDLLAVRLNYAGVLRQLGDLSGAQRVQQAVLESCEEFLPEDDPELLRARLGLAATMFERGLYAEARALQEAVVEARERTLLEDHPDLLFARSHLALTLRNQGELARARSLQEMVLQGYERTRPKDHFDVLRIRENLAITLAQQGDLPGARRLQESVLEVYGRVLPEDSALVLKTRMSYAEVLRQLGDLERSRTLLGKVLRGLSSVLAAESPVLLGARLNLAIVVGQQGDAAAARTLLEDLLEDCERALPEGHTTILSARWHLANTMRQEGDLDGSLTLLRQVLEAYELALSADHRSVHAVRLGLVDNMRGKGDLVGAREMLNRVLESYGGRLPQDDPDVLLARSNLAAILLEEGDLAEARAMQEAVLEDYRLTFPEDHPAVLRIQGHLAVTAMRQGDFARARELQEAVLEQYRRSPDTAPSVFLREGLNLVGTLLQQGDPDAARALCGELGLHAIDGLARASSTLSRREARAVAAETAYGASVLRFLNSVAPSAESEALCFELAETMRDVTNLDLGAGIGADPDLAELRAEVGFVRGRIGDLLAAPSGGEPEAEAVAEDVASLGTRRDALERRLRTALAESGAFTRTIQAAEVARGLPPDALAIGYFRMHGWREDPGSGHLRYGGDVLGAHVVGPDGSLHEVELGPIEEFEALARSWRAALGVAPAASRDGADGRGVPLRGVPLGREGEPVDEAAAGRVLRQRILDPLLAGREGLTRLFVCSADLVHTLPLEALPLDGGVVGDRWSVVNEISLRRFVAPAEPPPEGGELAILAVGGVDFGAAAVAPETPRTLPSARIETPGGEVRGGSLFRDLPETREEVRVIGNLFADTPGGSAAVLTGAAATKAGFHELAPGKRYLHVATHGWFKEVAFAGPRTPDPLLAPVDANEVVTSFTPMGLCGLAFAGANRGRDSLGRVPGVLTAEELAGIDLSDCELAVLSACETNVGLRSAGLGIQSLQSALHTAGVRTAVTSLWKVEDEPTRELMKRFYAYLLRDGWTRAAALWRAKCDLREDGHPKREWAAWVLSGDPD